jgi:ribosomal protein S27E
VTSPAPHLRTIALTWHHLTEALGEPVQHGAFGLGLRGYLANLEQYDAQEAAALRALERSPDQLGERPIPIRLRVHDTMHVVRATLLDCADYIAEFVQRDPIPMPKPRRAAVAKTRAERVAWDDHARRVQAAQNDAADTRRWKWTGTRPDVPYAALWLLARVEGAPGPFRPLAYDQRRYIGHVAAGCVQRIENVLDTAARTATLTRPCPDCAGTITVYGGAGASPLAHCDTCGGIWTEQGAAA